MNEEMMQPSDAQLRELLQGARPEPALPPGFQSNVWRRIEKGEQASGWILERLAGWVLTPRLATAGLAAVVLLAAGAGAMRGMRTGEQDARDRYVSSVDPSYLQR